MALVRQRDLDAVVGRFTDWLEDGRGSTVEVTGVDRPTEGWSSETVLVRALVDGVDEGFALRLPPLGEGIFPTYDLGLQALAQAAAAGGGVPTAVPATVVGDDLLVMPLIEGHVPGEMPAFDPWVTNLDVGRQRRLHEQVADLLADLHTIDVADLDLPRREIADELTWWTAYLAWSGTGNRVPAIAGALDRCAATAPSSEPPPALLWGDVRLGNVVFTGDGSPAAVLDWEMATIGAPEHDLGWWWGLEAMQDELVGDRAEAFAPLEELQGRYEARAGRTLQDLAWYEAFALLRSAAILTRIGLVQERAGQAPRMALDDNPVLDHLVRRVAALG